MSSQKRAPFKIDAVTIDGLIRMDHLHPSRRMDSDAVFAAALEALRVYVGKEPPPPPVKFSEMYEVTSGQQARYYDLVLEALVTTMVRTGLMSGHTAICMANDILAKAQQTYAGDGVIQSAAFARRSLEFALREEGLL
jgi:hypothetical protein